jgi:hypothetical protein
MNRVVVVLVLMASVAVSVACGQATQPGPPQAGVAPLLKDNLSIVSGYSNVVVVSIDEERLERVDPPGKHTIHKRGAVVRSFKGTSTPGEQIRYATAGGGGQDVPIRFANGDVLKHLSGEQRLLIFDVRSDGEMFLDAGQEFPFDGEVEELLKPLFGKK